MGKFKEKRRVVVTGLGLITPLGLDVPSTWQALLAGKSGIDSISGWGELDLIKEEYQLAPDFPFIAGEIKGFNIKEIIQQRKNPFLKEDLKRR